MTPQPNLARPASNMARYPSLAGQRVFVTGGGTGIGASIVESFAQQGAQVAFVDLAETESQALVDRITTIAAARGATPAQVALAWLLAWPLAR